MLLSDTLVFPFLPSLHAMAEVHAGGKRGYLLRQSLKLLPQSFFHAAGVKQAECKVDPTSS